MSNPNVPMINGPYNTYPVVSHNPPTTPYSLPQSQPSTSVNRTSLQNVEDEFANMRRPLDDLTQDRGKIQIRANAQRQSQANKFGKMTMRMLHYWRIRFSGDKVNNKYQTLECYIKAVYQFVQSLNISETDMMSKISSTLKGTALSWFLTIPNKDELSLGQFVNLLRSRFAGNRSRIEVILSLCARKYESKSGYIMRHFDLLIIDMAYLCLSEEMKLVILIKTLPNIVKRYAIIEHVQCAIC